MPEQVGALRERLQRADAQPVDYSDIPELPDEWFLRAAREGSRYQTHINAVLRAYMQAKRIVQTR